ncbi:MAG: cob(I)yrinic acid a,c-diamide adenosyltransferase [Bacillota bacterium]
MRGLVHIYTGDGKGKTTAAIGLGVRACGRGLKVLMVQFLKGAPTGEEFSLERLGPGFTLYRGTSSVKFVPQMSEDEKNRTAEEQLDIFRYAREAAASGKYDLIILDEAFGAIASGMLDANALVRFVKDKPENLELVLTGRGAPKELIDLADYVSEIHALKHPMEKGVKGRRGIEF